MSIPRSAFGLAILFLAVSPLTIAHGQYSTLGDLLHWYAHSAQTHPSLVRYTELREPGYEHAVVPLATFTNYGAGEARARNKSSVMLVFGEHARELITCEVGLWFSRVLLGDTAEIFSWAEWPEAFKPLNIPPESIQATVQGWVRRILDNMLVKVLPVENVDGRQAWEAGNLCLRKTSKGIDLNRNYPFAFATEPPHSEMYGGPHPFSEAQSRLIARIALEGGGVPKAYINVHSGEWAVYSGWDSKAAVGPGLPADLSDLLIRSGDVCRCQAGPAGAVSNYLAYGTGMDFMYTQLGVPYALTYEVYGRAGPFDDGEPGRIPDGTHNKPLSDYPYVIDDGIARAVPRVEDLLGSAPQHHRAHNQHQRARDSRRARANAARLRRSAVDAAGEEGGVRYGTAGGPGVGDGGRRRAGVGLGSRDIPAGVGSGTALRGDGADGGRSLLEAASRNTVSIAAVATTAATTASHSVTSPAALSAVSSVGPLGGRSMRRLVAAAMAVTSAEAGVAEVETAEGSDLEGAAASVATGRALTADLSRFSGPDGPILAMVRSQPGMHQGCFDMFNPPPGAAYRDVVSRWVVILLMTLNHVADPAHPRPSPHPLPGTVLAGAGVGGEPGVGAGAGGFGAAFGTAALGRRRLMEASEGVAEGEVGGDGVEQRATENESGAAVAAEEEEEEEEEGEAVVPVAAAGPKRQAGGVGASGNGYGGDPYGSAGFDRRVQQQTYEVDPVMRQHSLVVLVAICCMGVVFVPWFMCAANTMSRPVPPAIRRPRQQQQLLQPQLPLTRAYV